MVNLLLSDLQNKDLISIVSGNNLGKIVDVEINNEGKITKIYAEQSGMLTRMFRQEEFTFSFSEIEKIGTDVILLKH